MYPDLQDKVVMITGAAGSLGMGVVHAFAGAGSQLALLDVERDKFAERYGDDLNTNWLLLAGDVTQADAVNAALAAAVERFGGVDVLVNIAGGYTAGQPVHEMHIDTWDKMMALNAKSVFVMGNIIAGHMVERAQGGRIINIGAKPGLAANGNDAAYSASKSAVLRLTEAMSKELKLHNINVNAVLPALLDTPANRSAMPNADFSKWVTPASMADVIMFLAADASRDISGALIPVYGALV
ncbi:MAG: SDR family NAD(P)-dependent oxidoreductase [Anaerolineales bacterium]